MGGPAGFENVVASVSVIDPDDTTTAAHWGITFPSTMPMRRRRRRRTWSAW